MNVRYRIWGNTVKISISSQSSFYIMLFYLWILISCLAAFLTSSYLISPVLPGFNRKWNRKSYQTSDWKEIVIESDSQLQRLDIKLSSLFPQYSRSYLSSLCENDLVLVNGRPQDKKFKVKPKDVIQIRFLEKQVSSVEPENIPLDIIYEDDDIIVINKPVGMVVHPAPGSPNGTFVNALLYHLGPTQAAKLFENSSKSTAAAVENSILSIFDQKREESEEEIVDEDRNEDVEDDIDLPETPDASKATPKSLRPGIVHRLDKGTSGVLLAGKHSDAVFKLSRMFAQRQVRKIYLVICIGHPGESTTIFDPIGRSPKNRQLMIAMDGPPGKPAISHVKTIAFDGKLSAALVRIETGRTHQIRVHLQSRRTPVAGDDDYGNKEWNKKLGKMLTNNGNKMITRPLLHAYETEISHPYTGEKVVFRAPIPEDIASILCKLDISSSILSESKLSDKNKISSTNRNSEVKEKIESKMFNYSVSSIMDQNGYLSVSTKVTGKTFDSGQKNGFVPSDRVIFDHDNDYDWMPITLPDE